MNHEDNKVVPLTENTPEHQSGEAEKPAKWPGRKGIYLLPNLFTTGALFSGFYAVVASMNGHFENAAIAIFIAMILDGLDGRVARLTNTQSDFGAEYDSLADMVSFGVAPALVAFSWALQDLGKVGWVAAFVYVAGAALRLARFNTQLAVADKNFFTGLASPAAAAIVAGTVWAFSETGTAGADIAWLMALIVPGAGLLMVSNFRYHSFKGLDLKGKVPFVALLAVVMVFVVVSIDPAKVLLGVFMAYALSGPVYDGWSRLKQKK
ncbi:CDP-diacylglycerol--serine O-phosphatidyltransferase [Bacterioplanoides pacificum]|uniref:CDP-diacylglycerol--serine O-phosphatidyltransferase n=1 Tax=Bacterioplanoides pacificum TaxID=1171596 RepID=A0ABV7VW21_9GAMM